MSGRQTAVVLSILLLAFAGRVLGQILVVLGLAPWLPPMDEWYSGLMRYRWLLPCQVVILAIYGRICVDLFRGTGFFAEPRRGFGTWVYGFGWVYLAAMVARYPLRMWLVPEARWFGQTIPIFFHWVLALFLVIFGHWHRVRTTR